MNKNLIGQYLDRYHIIEPLGEGGMATVYKAYDTRLETDVAVKVIRTEVLPQNAVEQSLKRFEREAKSLAKLTHPNIVKVTDYGEYEGMPYLVMPYLPGGTLKQRLGKPIPWQEAVKLLLPIAEALDYAHSQKIIHRDVKPSNILLTQRGQPMLTDFGLAKILENNVPQSLTGTGIGVGTPEYMAPEQVNARDVDGRADIYSLGIVLYELVIGRKPYIADTPMAVMIMQARDPLPRPTQFIPDLNEQVEKVLLKALAKKPEDRYEDMAGFTRAMEGLLSGVAQIPAVSIAAQHVIHQPSEPDTQMTIDQFEVPNPEPIIPNPGHATHTLTPPDLTTAAPAPSALQSTPTEPRKGHIPKRAQYDKRSNWWPWVIGPIVLVVIAQGIYYGSAGLFPIAPAPTPTLVMPTISNARVPIAMPVMTPISTTRTKDGMVMVQVLAGEFLMGSDPTKDKYSKNDEQPQRIVSLDSFWIDQTEVTNGMFVKCVEAGACDRPVVNSSNSRDSYYGNNQFDDYPVINVSWNQAKAYCTWAGAKLPTEAQWELAARGTDGRTYPWGEGIDCNMANYSDCGGDTKAVGSYPGWASPYGALDMAGNVHEWVADWYDSNYYNQSPSNNPTGLTNGESRVIRGGSWYCGSDCLRASSRSWYPPGNGGPDVGFRCARNASP
jgi:eukaryotic-like serine/threonine-protein kinase